MKRDVLALHLKFSVSSTLQKISKNIDDTWGDSNVILSQMVTAMLAVYSIIRCRVTNFCMLANCFACKPVEIHRLQITLA